MKPFNSTLNINKPLKRTKALNKVSLKQERIKREENKLAQEMLEQCGGKCMICGKTAPLQKNHTRNRRRFILSCVECHFPDGYHKYLDDWSEL